MAVEDGVAQLHHAVPLGDPLQVGGRDVFKGADDRPGDVSETVPEVSLVQERHGAGVLLLAGLGRSAHLVALGVRGDAGDLVAVHSGVWTVESVGVVPAILDVLKPIRTLIMPSPSPDIRLKADVALHVVIVSPEEAVNVIVGVV